MTISVNDKELKSLLIMQSLYTYTSERRPEIVQLSEYLYTLTESVRILLSV